MILKSIIEILKQMKDAFIYFFLTILAVCPYMFFGENAFDGYFSDNHFNYVLMSLVFSFIAIYKLFSQEKLFRSSYPNISKVSTLFIVLFSYFIVGTVIYYFNSSYAFKEKIDFNKSYSIEQEFSVSHESKYRVLLLSYYDKPIQCLDTCRNEFIYFNASLELYEDGKQVMFFPAPQKHSLDNGVVNANINQVVLKPFHKYKFVSHINKTEMEPNSEFYIEIRTEYFSKLRENSALIGIYLYLASYAFFFFFCLCIIAGDNFIKILRNKKK